MITRSWSKSKRLCYASQVTVGKFYLDPTTVTVFVAINIWLQVTAIGDALVTSTTDLLSITLLLCLLDLTVTGHCVFVYALCPVLCRTSAA